MYWTDRYWTDVYVWYMHVCVCDIVSGCVYVCVCGLHSMDFTL